MPKAYRVVWFDKDCGVWAGYTQGQAQAAFVREADGFPASSYWPYLSSSRAHGPEADLAIERYLDRGKYWRDTLAFARLLAKAKAFNAQYPVGTPVRIVGCGEADQWPEGMTVTRTPAWAIQGSVLVSVEGQAGGMYLRYVHPRQPDEAFTTDFLPDSTTLQPARL